MSWLYFWVAWHVRDQNLKTKNEHPFNETIFGSARFNYHKKDKSASNMTNTNLSKAEFTVVGTLFTNRFPSLRSFVNKKVRNFNVCFKKILSKHSNYTLLSLLRIFMKNIISVLIVVYLVVLVFSIYNFFY